tara:strand:+ start:599 stop:1042 length:444 start_codon:yes stop_codon:yes gene_type:complete
MQCNPAAIAIIKHYEGFSSTPYKCPAGYWTYGYGNIRDAQGERVTSDTEHITELEGETLLLEEMAKVERQIKALTTAELTVNQFSALCSFVWNVGSGRYKASTLRAKLNRCDYEGASAEFPKWRRGGGKILPGLVRRRKSERELFDG